MPDDPPTRKIVPADMGKQPPQHQPRPADPCAMVIFGATGDLTKRLVVPALYNLARTKMLPEKFALIGVARAKETAESWRDHLHDMLKSFVDNATVAFNIDHIDEVVWEHLASKMSYVQGDLATPELYEMLHSSLEQAKKTHDTKGNAIFYLGVTDQFFGTVVDHLGQFKLTDQNENKNGKPRFWRRVVIEKPFGNSLNSARKLNDSLRLTLHEDQIFRIDHFMGKEAVQNITALRFANGMFEPIWNRDRIDHVQITIAETVGVEKRGAFYEETGALRDMVPNHIFSLISMLAMEPPAGSDAQSIRTNKTEVFSAMLPINPAQAVRGQYGAGTVLGRQVKAYRKEPNVAAGSNIETYVAMQLEINNWRWAGVPFYIRTGKHMSRRKTEIAIRFKQAPHAVFQEAPLDTLPPDWLVLSITPKAGILVEFAVKRPGPVEELAAVNMDFRYYDWFPNEPSVGYETLIYDVMIGDPRLFMSAEMVEKTWRIVQPVLDAWAAETSEIPLYKSGSDGPKAADKLLARDGGRAWRPVSSIAGQTP
jgi:glucose-6-phosphate 1-dehydrogenase